MKKQILILLIICILIIATVVGVLYVPKQEHKERVSERKEQQTTEETTTYSPTSGKTYPLYFSIMIHMEENFKDDTDTALFQRHVEQLEWAMDIFEEYDAKVTIETEVPFATAVINNDASILSDAIAGGHGVGTHCGKDMDTSSVSALTESYKERKELVDSIVGAENNRGCSGGWGTADYVIAATNAGFGYLDGVVYLAYLAIPQSERPEQVSNQDIKKIYYHDPVIPEFSDHIYPRFLENADDFEEDADGALVLLNGELGEIASLSEGRQSCVPNCALTEEDFDFIYDKIETANEIRDDARVAHLYVHVPLKIFAESNDKLLRRWLSEMQTLQKQGDIEWATQGEVYDAKMSERE
jgi:hypothetical protein